MGYLDSSLVDDCSDGFRWNCSLLLYLLKDFSCLNCRVLIDCCLVCNLGEVIRIGLNAYIEFSKTREHIIVARNDLGLVDGLAIFLVLQYVISMQDTSWEFIECDRIVAE